MAEAQSSGAGVTPGASLDSGEVSLNVGPGTPQVAGALNLDGSAPYDVPPPAWLTAERSKPSHPRTKRSALFYVRQGALVDAFMQTHIMPTSEDTVAASAEATQNIARVACIVNFCFAANVLLLASNIFVVVWSGSLAVVAASSEWAVRVASLPPPPAHAPAAPPPPLLVDCALDLLSTGIIYFTARKQAKVEPYTYPIGKSRLEPLSIVIFASIMAMAAMQLTVEAAQSIARTASTGEESLEVDTLTIVLLAISVGVKCLLMATCYWQRSLSDSVLALALEYRNDAIITVSSLAAVVIASRVRGTWWLDPATAIASGCRGGGRAGGGRRGPLLSPLQWPSSSSSRGSRRGTSTSSS